MSSGYFGQSTAPDPRNLGQELQRISTHSGPVLGTEEDFSKAIGQDQLGLEGDFANQAMSLYPQLASAEQAATSSQRGQDAADLKTYGPQIEAALGKINPGWQQSLGQVNAQAANAMNTTPLLGQLNTAGSDALGKAQTIGPSALRTELTQSAQDQLALGSSLSADQERDVDQSSRQAFADRGLVQSNPSIATEVLNRDAAGQQRLAQREAFAGQIQQMGQSEDASNTQQQVQLGNFAQGVQGQNQQSTDAGRQYLLSAQQANQNAFNPVLGLFNQRTDVSPTAAASYLSGAPNIIGAGSQAMDPILSYGSDVYNTNFNSDAATRINNSNNMAAIHGAIIGAVGSMAGGAMKACWVAREIFKTEAVRVSGRMHLKWALFQDWLLSNRCPAWLRKTYLAHGLRFADWLSWHPRCRRWLRPLMERVVKAEIRRHTQVF